MLHHLCRTTASQSGSVVLAVFVSRWSSRPHVYSYLSKEDQLATQGVQHISAKKPLKNDSFLRKIVIIWCWPFYFLHNLVLKHDNFEAIVYQILLYHSCTKTSTSTFEYVLSRDPVLSLLRGLVFCQAGRFVFNARRAAESETTKSFWVKVKSLLTGTGSRYNTCFLIKRSFIRQVAFMYIFSEAAFILGARYTRTTKKLAAILARYKDRAGLTLMTSVANLMVCYGHIWRYMEWVAGRRPSVLSVAM